MKWSEPETEFTKPLRGVAERQKRRPGGPIAVVAGLALLSSLPIVHFYGGFSLLSGLVDQREIAASSNSPVQPEIVQAPSPETTATIPGRGHKLDPEGGAFQEVKTQGQFIPVAPIPVVFPKAPEIKRQEISMAHLPDPDIIDRVDTGVIPRVSADGLRAMDVYSRQPDTEGNFGVARVVIVIGGLGISQTSTQQAINDLPANVTLAFAPYGNSLNRWMQQARKSGHELLLQVPMEPIDFPENNPGPHTLTASADLQENLENLHWMMSRITNYVGVTNYLGQKMLQEPASFAPIFAEVSKRGLLFFEDGTVKNTMGPGVALKELVPYAKADIQIDNVRSRSAIAKKLRALSEQAKRTGVAIGMGNAFPDTISLVAEYARQAKKNGIEITPVSAVVKDRRR